MTEATNEPFCPLYKEAIASEPWVNIACANRGLLFDKFASAWRMNGKSYEFDKGVGTKKEGAGKWLHTMTAKCGDSGRLSEACERQREFVAAMGGETLLLRNTSRFITGMGREHPLENGFSWHHTLGVPYLPGSSLKGLVRTWYRETYGNLETDQRGNLKWKEDLQKKDVFVKNDGIGRFVFLDMLPTAPPKLTVDVMTPHYGPYYQDDSGQTTPGDWHSPVPINFLVADLGSSWQVAVLPRIAGDIVSPYEIRELTDELGEAFQWLGAGAKTAVGYGRFERDTDGETRLRVENEKKAAEQENTRREAAEQAEFEKSLENDSEPLRQLKRVRKQQNWQPMVDQNMISVLQRFAEEHPDPPQDSINWIRELLESIPKYKGVWDEPEKMKGKKKDKHKYSAERVRELVKKINPNLQD